jgi:selenide,water dikinase
LDQVLSAIPRVTNSNVLVGFDTSDDAGVYRLTPECALVQTVDFFTPIVDDPYTFGAIAAANSLSDVYAMGGVPVTALSVLAYPGKGDLHDLEQILRGGAAKINESGCVIIGGHSVSDDEIKFGYAVTGTVHPDRIWTNTGARLGDVAVLTKAIGTGVIGTALKRGTASEEHVRQAVDSMLTLNRDARDAAAQFEVHACTDVTGFGLLGHAREMIAGSDLTLEIDASRVRFLPGAAEYAREGAVAGGLNNNREFVSPCVEVERPVDAVIETLLYDPQTSGGLLLSLPASDAEKLVEAFPAAFIIGSVRERGGKPIRLI